MRGSLNIRGVNAPALGRAGEDPVGGRPLPVAGVRGYHPGNILKLKRP